MNPVWFSLRLWNTDEYRDLECLGSSGSENPDEESCWTEFRSDLAKELGSGVFDCLLEVTFDYYQCNHPLDPVEWDVDYGLELLAHKEIPEKEWREFP